MTNQVLKRPIIVTGDWHLREDCPPCRKGDWMGLQKSKIESIFHFAEEHHAVILHTGDLFHSQKPSISLIVWLLKLLDGCETPIYILPGNHDTKVIDSKQDSRNVEGTALDLLRCASDLVHIIYSNFLLSLSSESFLKPILQQVESRIKYDPSVFVNHTLIFPDDKFPDGINGVSAKSFIKQIDNRFIDNQISYICTGDNHEAFTYTSDNITLINPGCLTRQRISEQNYEPGFYIIQTDGEIIRHAFTTFTTLLGNAEPFTWDETYIQKHEQEKNETISKFVESLSEDYKVGISFHDNLSRFCQENKIEKRLMDIVEECVREK